MRFPFFTSFIIFVIITQMAIRRTNNMDQSNNDEFWAKESKANATRRKSLEGLNYISIPLDKLPFGTMPEDDEVLFCERAIQTLSSRKIVNLTGLTNTDLKLEYGAPNISALTNYDQNYTSLVTNLQKWGKLLYDAGFYKEASIILEFSVSTRTDVTASYRLLCDMYQTKLGLTSGEFEQKIRAMIPVAESLKSLSKEPILNLLNSYLTDLT